MRISHPLATRSIVPRQQCTQNDPVDRCLVIAKRGSSPSIVSADSAPLETNQRALPQKSGTNCPPRRRLLVAVIVFVFVARRARQPSHHYGFSPLAAFLPFSFCFGRQNRSCVHASNDNSNYYTVARALAVALDSPRWRFISLA